MIKFQCKGCGQRIRVSDDCAGRRGKCPKCKGVVVVPSAELTEVLSARNAVKADSGLDVEIRLKDEPVVQQEKSYGEQEALAHQELLRKRFEDDKPPERKLPAVVDVFLYPISATGLINLAVFWVVPFLIALGNRVCIITVCVPYYAACFCRVYVLLLYGMCSR